MKYIFIDDSIHDRGKFIISGFVFADRNPNDYIKDSLKKNGFNPAIDEFKSGASFRRFPKMIDVRNDLKAFINRFCKIGLVVLPKKERKQIGLETLKGLIQFILSNNLNNRINIFIDNNFFGSEDKGFQIAKDLDIERYKIHFEQDSKKIRGIQLADLIAHTCSIMLLESMGLINKKVKAGDNSGYDPDMDIELGFELWATIRYNFLSQPKNEIKNNLYEATYDIFPYGLYISDKCDKKLRDSTINRFGDVYLGCIH